MNAGKPKTRCNVVDLKAGQRLEDQIFRIAQKELRTTSNGGLYIHAVLADATGQILGRMWNASQEIFDTIPHGGFLAFRGRVESYKGAPQFIIDGLRCVEPGSFDPSEFLPSSERDVEAMWEELKTVLRQVAESRPAGARRQVRQRRRVQDAASCAPRRRCRFITPGWAACSSTR